MLNRLAYENRVRLLLVPGHTGIRVNEIADRLAILRAKTKPTGPKPLGVPMYKAKE